MSAFEAWVGRTREVTDTIRPAQVHALEAVLEGATGQDPHLREGDVLPALWHFVFFHDVEVASRLGPDGHPARGGFLPPVPLPRRMWAGGRFAFHGPVPIGAEVVKRSKVLSVEEKDGRSGRLCFVTVAHDLLVDGEVRVAEEQDIVYREQPVSGTRPPEPPAAPGADHAVRIVPDPVLLFRYSALTFNGHRIHYDRTYATQVEGYEGLVFHGPLTATLLAGLAEQGGDARHVLVPRRLAAARHRPVHDRQGRRAPVGGQRGGPPRHDGGGDVRVGPYRLRTSAAWRRSWRALPNACRRP